ncbi:hypothetical protein ACFYU8_10200 [Brevibacillus sp. NPDC003359]|uniref:hypothetical protein n=1 Tax=unclassified Brevibacillus TaxID=2684853 RepID=UPI003684E795
MQRLKRVAIPRKIKNQLHPITIRCLPPYCCSSYKYFIIYVHLGVKEHPLHTSGRSCPLNELEEYERILHAFLSESLPPANHPVELHLLWLSDAVGHAANDLPNRSNTFT